MTNQTNPNPLCVFPIGIARVCVPCTQVWTVAQVINFKYVPPAYRVLFGTYMHAHVHTRHETPPTTQSKGETAAVGGGHVRAYLARHPPTTRSRSETYVVGHTHPSHHPKPSKEMTVVGGGGRGGG
jgi:hypothetical protein